MALQTLARPDARLAGSAPGLGRLVRVELGKSLSTRSGKAVLAATALLAPHWVPVLVLTGGDVSDPPRLLAELGALTALLVLSLGVLSSAGETTHRTALGTYLAVPRRGRVLAAKTLALAQLGAYATATGVVTSAAILAVLGVPVPLGPTAVVAAVATLGGAAFAVTGVGIGAAIAHTPAALTGSYLVLFLTPPLLHGVWPAAVEAVDPRQAVILLATTTPSAGPLVTLLAWVVGPLAVGFLILTRRDIA
ncbi:hypothetical protein Psed_6399 [Pseudonocardia dioxanivorans CB1190]|uniref:ABC transporter permease n=1 Tax=Pseudonocardia dioxanivorans (strain ATCC 55486 / DSM 44775 / JCM 13855 / CB1190) TaxID=675635 RepID=F4CTJ1_PSEUX|nr:hypothetical protein [Pseudonocardia dioxanivorans]AEA28494.1 hypothetical protein Psed_6399 [Pseudonocardia dioxanivorans CB1190]